MRRKALQSEESFSDPCAKKLYNIIQVTSDEIGFHWPTQMLMQQILGKIESNKNDDDLEADIMHSFSGGKKLWEGMKGHIKELREIADEEED